MASDLPPTRRRPRSDGLRNRELIVCTARRLFAEAGPQTPLDEIAAAAKVGKGTLFRHFEDRAALIAAILDEEETAFQEAVIRGRPPLGPGVGALERLTAFGIARLAMLAQTAATIQAHEVARGAQRLRSPVRAGYARHLTMLLREIPGVRSPEIIADVLMEALSGQLYVYESLERGQTLGQLQAAWSELVQRLARPM